MLTKLRIKETLNNIGLKSNDTIMIHSSLKSIGKIEGNAEGLIEALKEYFYDGLIIFPTHTWATINKDDMVFDVNNTPSCVGMLTEIARKTEGFTRSMHPTHSVCAYGKKSKEYIELDNNATTPVGPNNCFGALKNMNAKILFLGAPLTKNTFIHSIEEEYDVPDRFTEHIYHFISINNDKIIDYYMPRHFSTKNAHLSEHYQKLLPKFLELNIGTQFYFGEAKSYLIDAKKAYEYVCSLLENNLHIFDDYSEIK